MSFPVVEALFCTVKPKTYKITSYLLRMAPDQRIRQEDMALVETTLKRMFPHIQSWRISSRLDEGRAIVRVGVGPSESIERADSFAVYNALRKFVRPRVPHSSLLVLKASRPLARESDVEALILGHPSERILDQLELGIRALPDVQRVDRRRGNPVQFTIAIKGSVEDAYTILPFLNQLRDEVGIASLVVMSSLL